MDLSATPPLSQRNKKDTIEQDIFRKNIKLKKKDKKRTMKKKRAVKSGIIEQEVYRQYM